MGQRAQGYRLRQATKGGTWKVRFRIDGQRREFSTGTSDRSEAEREARRIYGEELTSVRPERRRASGFTLTTRLASAWIASLALRPKTVGNYEEFTVRWMRSLSSWDDAALAAYARGRLREALSKTIKSELSAMRGLVSWLVEVGELEQAPLVPSLPKSALGTPSKRRTRVAAPTLSKREVTAFLKRLPDVSLRDGWWVRPRCEFLYLSSLRPSTVDALSVPEHWMPGSRFLNITSEIDKEGFAREQPLSRRAVAILTRCAPEKGVIFGEHKYFRYVRRAAKGTLTDAKAAIFTGQHLRSARATHLLDSGASLTGAQYLLGHTRASTTARYLRPSKKEALKALNRAG